LVQLMCMMVRHCDSLTMAILLTLVRESDAL
jgi:hypothetical protein